MNQELLLIYMLVCWYTMFVVPIKAVSNFTNITFNVTSFNFCQSENQQFEIYVDVNIHQCVEECGLRMHCQSLSYHNEMRLCRLFQYEEEVTSSRPGCTHVVKSDIQLIEDPCQQNCSYGTACDRDTQTCIVKECVEDLVNITLLGNKRGVGSVVRWFTQNDVIVRSTCLPSGNWSYEFNTPNANCFHPFGCYKTFADKNLAGHDLVNKLVVSLKQCLEFCATTDFKVLLHSDTSRVYGVNCFCKSISVQVYTNWYGGLSGFPGWILYEKLVPIPQN